MEEPEANFPCQTGIIDGYPPFGCAIINRSKLYLPESLFENLLRY